MCETKRNAGVLLFDMEKMLTIAEQLHGLRGDDAADWVRRQFDEVATFFSTIREDDTCIVQPGSMCVVDINDCQYTVVGMDVALGCPLRPGRLCDRGCTMCAERVRL